VPDGLEGVQSVIATNYSFTALKTDGTVIQWGRINFDGDLIQPPDGLGNVQSIAATQHAFAALKEDGTVVTWGHSDYGGNSSGVQDQLTGVRSISASNSAFAALKNDGSVVAWGDSNYGGDSSRVRDQLNNIVRIVPVNNGFVALRGAETELTADLTAVDAAIVTATQERDTARTQLDAARNAAGNKVTLRALERSYPGNRLLDVTGTSGNKKLPIQYDLQRSTDLQNWTDITTEHTHEIDAGDNEAYYYLAPKP
jgi:hypothetical protein